jgi:hypothetical protein
MKDLLESVCTCLALAVLFGAVCTILAIRNAPRDGDGEWGDSGRPHRE